MFYFRTVATQGEPSFQLALACPSCNVQSFEDPDKMLGDYAIIAQIASMAKSSDTSEDAPDFVLHGSLIDSRFIGDYALDSSNGGNSRSSTERAR